MPLSSRTEISVAFTLGLAMILTSFAWALAQAKAIPAAMIMIMNLESLMVPTLLMTVRRILEAETGLHHQGIGVGFESLRVHLRIEAIRIRSIAKAIHEVTLD